VEFLLRTASTVETGALVAFWHEAAENSSRPPDSAEAVAALLGRDPDAVILAEHDGELIGSVIAGWDGWRYQILWAASGYHRQDDWRRWVKKL
jgi:hypothetical protein